MARNCTSAAPTSMALRWRIRTARRRSACATESSSSLTDLSPRRRKCWAATTSSRRPHWTGRSRRPRCARARSTARWRSGQLSTSAAEATVEAVARCFRDDAGRTVATLARALGDLQLAEDALQDAYLAALERWPRDGFPARPPAWILATARNRAIDRLRRDRLGREKLERLAALEIRA